MRIGPSSHRPAFCCSAWKSRIKDHFLGYGLIKYTSCGLSMIRNRPDHISVSVRLRQDCMCALQCKVPCHDHDVRIENNTILGKQTPWESEV